MHTTMEARQAIAGLSVGVTTSAQKTGAAKLTAIHRELVTGMPVAAEQELRVLVATLGDRTSYHSHSFPVTVYVFTGAFTLELEGRMPVTVRAGEASWNRLT